VRNLVNNYRKDKDYEKKESFHRYLQKYTSYDSIQPINDKAMAKTCLTCNKGTIVAGGYSNRVRATKFNPIGKSRKYPNLQWAPLADGSRIKICTKCIKAGKNTKIV